MYFEVTVNAECKSDLKYKYYTINEITTTETDHQVSYKSLDTSTKQSAITESVLYYTIEKKISEYRPSYGNYLLLNIDCNGSKIDFKNLEKDPTKKTSIIVIIIVVVIVAIIAVLIGLCVGCIKRKAYIEQQQPAVIYANQQMYYPQQGNMPIAYGGQAVLIGQANATPYSNNPNMQYSNLPANASMNQMYQIPNQQYNVVGQSSADRGYSSNAANENAAK